MSIEVKKQIVREFLEALNVWKLRIAAGEIAEGGWVIADGVSRLQQLGILPRSATAGSATGSVG